MSEYLGTTERAALLRAALKAKGWGARDISVKARRFSMGSAIDVCIKNPDVPLAEVRELAKAHEEIDRDQFGEILSGSNRYVEVVFSAEAREALVARFLPAVQEAAAKLEAEPSYLVPVEGSGFLLGAGRHGFGFSLWRGGSGSYEAEVSDAKEAAALIGQGGRR